MKKLSFSYVVKRISRVYDSCQSFRSLQMADKYCSLLSKAFKGSQIDLEMIKQLRMNKKLLASYRVIPWFY